MGITKIRVNSGIPPMTTQTWISHHLEFQSVTFIYGMTRTIVMVANYNRLQNSTHSDCTSNPQINSETLEESVPLHEFPAAFGNSPGLRAFLIDFCLPRVPLNPHLMQEVYQTSKFPIYLECLLCQNPLVTWHSWVYSCNLTTLA